MGNEIPLPNYLQPREITKNSTHRFYTNTKHSRIAPNDNDIKPYGWIIYRIQYTTHGIHRNRPWILSKIIPKSSYKKFKFEHRSRTNKHSASLKWDKWNNGIKPNPCRWRISKIDFKFTHRNKSDWNHLHNGSQNCWTTKETNNIKEFNETEFYTAEWNNKKIRSKKQKFISIHMITKIRKLWGWLQHHNYKKLQWKREHHTNFENPINNSEN